MTEHVIRYDKQTREFSLKGKPLEAIHENPVVLETYQGEALLVRTMLRLIREDETLRIEAYTDQNGEVKVLSKSKIVPFNGEYHGTDTQTAAGFERRSLSTALRSIISHAFFKKHPHEPLIGIIEPGNHPSLRASFLSMDPETNKIYAAHPSDMYTDFDRFIRVTKRNGTYTTREKAEKHFKNYQKVEE